jgi:hypothetical protein
MKSGIKRPFPRRRPTAPWRMLPASANLHEERG